MLKKQAAEEKKKNELQKLELVGTLAASTAHEIRNPLTGIKGLVQLLSEKYTHSDDQYFFKVIDTEISRINEIV
ncbi:Sporulation kinase D [Mycobacteroides abscessus subsp. abscessus]|nr:Sporulation kinase D [Mycobacteroides abscessus subsp. abscessus]